MKRLEEGTFSWPRGAEADKMLLKPEALALLLDGVDLRGMDLTAENFKKLQAQNTRLEVETRFLKLKL
ncbi:MAG: IS66 family insertion sequence element accessory protein TnpB [Verrucomicrobia bacterium]|nr:IS66 family insertion sequence element accessory protein TnpB [Verrucomicrobiota bacterium]